MAEPSGSGGRPFVLGNLEDVQKSRFLQQLAVTLDYRGEYFLRLPLQRPQFINKNEDQSGEGLSGPYACFRLLTLAYRPVTVAVHGKQ